MALNFNITYDASVASAPAAFKTVVNAVVQFFESEFTDPITINLDIGWGEVGGSALGSGALGESIENLRSYSYTQIRTALTSDATSSADLAAVATLAASDPTNGGNFFVTRADAKALGLLGPSTAVDGYVGFSSAAPFDYDDSNGVSGGQYDLFGTVAHEISEVMGRILLVGESIGSTPNSYSTMDLFHYSAPGVRDFLGTTAGYFSGDGGVTNLASFNTNPGGDFGDWASSVKNDSFDAFSNSGVVNAISPSDLAALDIIGYNAAPAAVAVVPSVADDFNGDGKSDILWQNTAGMVGVWEMNGTQVLSMAGAGQAPTSWQIAGTGDFNDDGKSDIVWRNSDGTVGLWEMNGTQTLSSTGLGQADNSWQIAGVGDFNGDGKSDLLWRNTNGSAAIWQMNGSQIVSETTIGQAPTSWQVAGVGDFNGDGKSDILWRNSNGAVGLWQMNGTQVTSMANVGQADMSWQIAGVGDFNGDGKSDILWQNTNGSVAVWEMNGSQILSEAVIGQDTGWQIAGTGDFNGDGKTDILFQNAGGSAETWQMNGAQIAAATVVGQGGAGWHVVA